MLDTTTPQFKIEQALSALEQRIQTLKQTQEQMHREIGMLQRAVTLLAETLIALRRRGAL